MKKNIKGLNYKLLKNIVLSSSLGICAACNHENIFNQDEAKPTPDDNNDQKDTTKPKENPTERIDPSKNVGDTNNNPDPQIKPSTTSDEIKPEDQPNIDSGNDSDTDAESSSTEKDSDNDGDIDTSNSEIDDSTTSEDTDSDSDTESSSTEEGIDNDTDTSDSETEDTTKNEDTDSQINSFENLPEDVKNGIDELVELTGIKNNAIAYVKDKIKFKFEKNNDNKTAFYLGEKCMGNAKSFLQFSNKMMDIVGDEDDYYKFDLSLLKTSIPLKSYSKLKQFPKKCFSNRKTFNFNFQKDGSLSAGWTGKLKTFTGKNSIILVSKKLFYIYDLNPKLVDNKSFNLSKVTFDNVEYVDKELFNITFFGNSKKISVSKVPFINFLPKFDFDNIYFEENKISFFNTDGICFFTHNFLESDILEFLKKYSVHIKNKSVISLVEKSIFFCNKNNKNFKFFGEKMDDNVDSFIKKLNFIQKLKNYGLVDIENIEFQLSKDKNILKIGNFDLLNFTFKTKNGDVFSVENIVCILDLLFRIFNIKYSVEKNDDNSIKLVGNKDVFFLFFDDLFANLEFKDPSEYK